MKVIINANIYNFHEFLQNQYVVFGGLDNSQIIECGDMKSLLDRDFCEVIDAENKILMPGLMIGHAHLYGFYMRGMKITPYNPATFTQNLRQLYWKMDSGLDREAAYHSAKAFGLEHIRNGVTMIVDHHASGGHVLGTLDELKRAFTDELGLRALYCFETSDRFSIDDCIVENVSFAKKNQTTMCRGLFGLHASMSVGNSTLEKVAMAQGSVPLHVHVGESLEDEVDCLNNYGMRIIQRFDSFGLLNPDSVVAHCVNIDESEAMIIKERGCIVAINPTSNMNTGVGLPDYLMMKNYGLPIMIGNDSLGSNISRCYNNMIYSMHLRYSSPWKVNQKDLLDCILTGYNYMSRMLGAKFGRIAPGYEADMLLTSYVPPTPIDDHNASAHVLDGVFDSFHPSDVWVGGEAKLRNSNLLFDEEEIMSKSRDIAQKYWKRME